ncbi:MAG: ArnT family glycosyltransferase, partial [Bradymonadia bacterium]
MTSPVPPSTITGHARVPLTQRQTRYLFWAIWCTVALTGWTLPLLADEAYYLDWSQQLAWGYFDHPPMVAYLINLFGYQPRLAAWCISTLSILVLSAAARATKSDKWWLTPLLFVTTPLGLSSGLFMTPDIPLVFGISIFLYALISKTSMLALIGLGIAFWSKPTALLLLPALLYRFGRAKALLIATGVWALCMPMLLWSSSNDWLPFAFQSNRAFSISWHSPLHVLEAFAAQLLVVGPLLAWGLWKLMRTRDSAFTDLGRYLCGPTLVVGSIASVGLRIEANWLITLWLPMIVLLPTLPDFLSTKAIKWHRGYSVVALIALISLPLLLSLLPIHTGPDRDSHRLATCIQPYAQQRRVVAVRYQELALLNQTDIQPYLL